MISQNEISLDTLYCWELGTGCNAWERFSGDIFTILLKIWNKTYFSNFLEGHKIRDGIWRWPQCIYMKKKNWCSPENAFAFKLEINNKRLPSIPCWDWLEGTKCIQYINLSHNLYSIVARKEDRLIHSLDIKTVLRISLHKAVISRC